MVRKGAGFAMLGVVVGDAASQCKSPQMPFRATVFISETDEHRIPGWRGWRCLTFVLHIPQESRQHLYFQCFFWMTSRLVDWQVLWLSAWGKWRDKQLRDEDWLERTAPRRVCYTWIKKSIKKEDMQRNVRLAPKYILKKNIAFCQTGLSLNSNDFRLSLSQA